MISTLAHMILPSSFWGWVGSSSFIIAAVVVGLYLSGGSKLVASVGEMVGAFLQPIAAKLGEFAANFMDWFGQGMKGIWDNPTVLAPLVIALGFGIRYFEGPQIVAKNKATTELSQCITREKAAIAALPKKAVARKKTVRALAPPVDKGWSLW